jgi:peptidoglycan/xylan/chitin deacetylase (PgdA/CDA1 family)
MYHSIDSSGSAISIDETAFRRHVDWLASGAVTVTSLDRLLSTPSDDDAVAVTFDDAFENFGQIAWPLLREQGLPVTVYVVTGKTGSTSDWNRSLGLPDLPLLDWDALGRLGEEGVDLGSHTQRHAKLPELDGERLEEEVAGSAAVIEQRTGRTPTAFAYPYGAVDYRSEAAVRAVYKTACGTRLAMLEDDPPTFQLPRLDSYYYRRPGRLEAWGSVRFKGHLGLRSVARSLRGKLEPRRLAR